MSNNFIVLFIFSIFLGCQAQNTEVKILEPEDFKQHIESHPVQLIDVRTPKEFDSGHIKNAKNIDFYSNEFGSKFGQLNKDKAIYIYCKSGNRSMKAANKLIKLGFTDIYDLKGGYLNWQE